jgi:hypothetical protein
MSTIREKSGLFFVGFYTWLITVYFGMVLLDAIYARLVPASPGVSPEISDLFLRIGGVIYLAASGAIIGSWNRKVARNYYIASAAIIFFEFLVPLFFSFLNLEGRGTGLESTARIVIDGTASILAFAGLYKFSRQP